jgi:hypothetical protein
MKVIQELEGQYVEEYPDAGATNDSHQMLLF